MDTYQRLREELDAIAARLRTPTPTPFPRKGVVPPITRSVSLEGYVALYDVDAERRRLLLRDIQNDNP